MNTIHISIIAYNAEETLRRAIDSVLAQTYKNYVLYVCDNGSTDNTRAIVNEYADKGLIKPFYTDKNFVFEGESLKFRQLCKNISDDDFFTRLDADDELYPEFFEKLVNFAAQNDLDIAAAGYYLYNLQTKEKYIYQHFIDNKSIMILETPEDYLEKFEMLYTYTWTIWGKLFRGNVSKYLSDKYDYLYASDTAAVLLEVTESRRVGILPEQLMCYYVGNVKSISNKYDKTRIYSSEGLFKIVRNLLLEKLQISKPNDFINIFSYTLFFSSVYETFKYNLEMDIPQDTKISEIIYLANCETNREFYKSVDYFALIASKSRNHDLFLLPLQWIHKNLKSIQPPRVRELYHLFFDVIYSAKEPKFLTAEIDFLLQFDIRVINSILCGVFEAPAKLLEKAPDSDLKNSILEKIRLLG